MAPDRRWRAVEEVLGEARRLGALGPTSIAEQIDHALGFASALAVAPQLALDLGSGGGLPGLVLGVLAWPDAELCLLDAQERRASFLRTAVATLGCTDRIFVRHGRTEDLAHDPELRAGFDAVTARSFGPPAVTAECAAGFLKVGGHLVVSEPPAVELDRWPTSPLAQLGLRVTRTHDGPPSFTVVMQVSECPPRYPRRSGVPERRPLWKREMAH